MDKMGVRGAAWLAWSVCLLSLALCACAVVLSVFFNGADVETIIYPLTSTVSAVVGGLVASRRPENPVGWFFLGSTVCFAFVAFASGYATYGLFTAPGALPGAWAMAWFSGWLFVPGIMLLLVFVPLYYPDGRLLTRRWQWLVHLAACFCVAGAVYHALRPGVMQNSEGIVNPLGIEALRPFLGLFNTLLAMFYFPLIFASAASLVVRYMRSGSVERQQIKWLAFAALAIPVWFLINSPIQAVAPNLFLVMDTLLVFTLVPLAAGMAILKYRLYDIDIIINRTLVYGVLTTLLALIYFGGVALLQGIGTGILQVPFRVLAGQESTLAVVASTLLIAALFFPLRRRIQGIIDRHFYRRKYDAAKTMTSFNVRLRNQTDLDTLSNDVLEVARRTVQPAHVSLWLRPDPEPQTKSPALRQFGHDE